MKLKNLLLGSVTAAGLMTGSAYAADLGVLTSVDVCDQLGISGLTISSDTNCLKVSGEVSYAFSYGASEGYYDEGDGVYYLDANVYTPAGDVTWGYDASELEGAGTIYKSEVTAKLNFEATADSSFGPAKAVIKLLAEDIGNGGGDVNVDEAYVAIGEGTVIMAGHKGSIYNNGDDEPLNWLGLFNSQAVNTGVETYTDTGTSNAIQITHDLGNGFSIAGGLENLEEEGTLVGVLAYEGDGISAHVSLEAWDVLEETDDTGYWNMHSGISATLDTIKIVAAVAADSNSNWSVLGSAQASLDMFTLAGAVEAAEIDGDTSTGAGASITAEVADGVKLNVGGRWEDYNNGDYVFYEIAAGAEAAIAENLTLSGSVGYVEAEDPLTYAWAKLAWAPGGGFTSSVKGTAYSTEDGESEYKIETEFKKTFE